MTAHAPLPSGKYALRVADYMMLGEAGVFGERRTELIEGDVIVMAPEFRPHGRVRDELHYQMRNVLLTQKSSWSASSGSVALSDVSMPQPDIVVTDEPQGEGAIPLSSVGLLVEVSSTTLDTHLGAKRRIYAMAGVPEYWVVDINARLIH